MSSLTPKTGIIDGTLDYGASVGSDILNAPTGLLDQVQNSISSVTTEFESKYGQGLDSFVQNVVETSNNTMDGIINSITNTTLDKETKDAIRSDIQNEDYNAAAEKTSSSSDFSAEELRTLYSKLDVTIAGTIVIDASNSVFPAPYVVGDNLSSWSGSNSSNYDFSYINSYEELLSEIRSIKREVSAVVVHWTDTFTNKHLTAEQIHDMHVAMGMDGIGYHYVIRRDGTLQRGRPADVVGEHSLNWNNDTLSIAFVGGYNCPTGTNNPEIHQSAESLTRSQFNTFDLFLEVVYQYIYGCQVVGHNDLQELEVDPGFDVINYCRSRFNKGTVFETPIIDDVPSRRDLNRSLLGPWDEDPVGTKTYELDY